ncbi:MEDS domain-containing protein [Fictibacillus sp. KIGAM418]|uniref:MEDS domain-containing protein n=1 Tax=Fictibacillus marinisediminis TaxID=2878389 RepID=A0A9X1X9N7_9BACL|nr:MEDS domain-containing protein [Fictibacillus marinisediminis]MCK6255525.1 MEDS domain-containing protein [Fictibacillus marinisediminis]
MNKSVMQLFNNSERLQGIHVFYYSFELESYIENAVSYIVNGVEQGDYILFLENERIYPLIIKELEEKLTTDQLKKVRFMNNFDFYFWNNNFYPQTILSNFSDIVTPWIEENRSIRTWGHVEWGDRKDFEKTLEEFEVEVDQMIKNVKVITVCAYDAGRVSDDLKVKLMEHHDFIMTDNEVLPINRS